MDEQSDFKGSVLEELEIMRWKARKFYFNIHSTHRYVYQGMNGLKELVPNQANFRELSFTKTRKLLDRHFLQSKFMYFICGEVGNVTRTFILEGESIRTLDFRPHS